MRRSRPWQDRPTPWLVDPVHRLVSFELRAPYDGLVQAGTPTEPLPAAEANVSPL
jgi:hypothetical protein